jgi:methionyl-tRNA formyltransferase
MFIFASMKDWNKTAFHFIIQNSKEQGIYVTTEYELKKALAENPEPKWVFFAHWSKIIPKHLCEKINGVIFHCTDLPYGRGGSPLQNLITIGYKNTKLSAIRLTEKLDSGNILLKSDLSLEGNAFQIFKRMSISIGEQCLKILANDFDEKPQSGEIVIFKRRKPKESNIMENKFTSIENFYDFIRMLDCDTYPRAFIDKDNYTIEFSEANFISKETIECTVRISKNRRME